MKAVPVVALICLLFASTASATVVRPAAEIASFPIQGIRFDMSPREAFDQLYAAGYRAGSINSFEEWETDGIEFVRGTYAGPDGESRVTFSRKDGRISGIRETWSRPRDHFNAQTMIGEMKQRFGIGEEEPTCRAAAQTSGNCRVVDAEEPNDVDLALGVQVLPGMLNRYIESKKAYR